MPATVQVVALASYLPLSGSTFGVEGDGLIPVDTALMEGDVSVHCVSIDLVVQELKVGK